MAKKSWIDVNYPDNKGYLKLDMDLFEYIEDLLASVLYHRLYYVWASDKRKDHDWHMINLRELANYFKTTAPTITSKIKLLVKIELIEYKTDSTRASYIKFNRNSEKAEFYTKRFRTSSYID